MKHAAQKSSTVTLADIRDMHRKAAALVIADPVYLPIFERLERELMAYETRQDAISRARAIAASQRAIA